MNFCGSVTRWLPSHEACGVHQDSRGRPEEDVKPMRAKPHTQNFLRAIWDILLGG